MRFKPQKFSLILLTFIAFILIVVSVASDSWVRKVLKRQEHDTYAERGLWQSCDPDCKPFTAEHAINTCRTFGIISCLSILFAWAFSIVAYIEYRVKGYMVSILSSFAAICMTISLFVYTITNEWTRQEYEYSWSFIVGWVSVIFGLLAGVFGLYDKTPKIDESVEMEDP